jgi:hypothetical protein
MSWGFDFLRPHQAGLICAFGDGKCVSIPAGTGYLHTITELQHDYEMGVRSLPTFTAKQRLAKTVQLTQISSMAVSGYSFSIKRDGLVNGKADIVSTGKTDLAFEELPITALDNVTSLTLTGFAVEGGADAQARLNSVQRIRAYYNGAWRYIVPTAVSAANPAVVTIPSLGGAGASIQYRVLFAPSYIGWESSFPAQLVESALRVSEMCINFGGAWNGTAFNGGFPLAARLESADISCKRDIKPEFTPCAGGTYAGRMLGGSPVHEIKLTFDSYDAQIDQMINNNEYAGIQLLCEGMEYSPGHKYTFERIYPRCAIINNSYKDNSGRLSQDVTVKVLADATYGQVITRVKNLWPHFGAV